MGLGINGGGIASAQFLAEQGALVTVTDLRNEDILADSIRQLSGYQIRYVLGKHEENDFKNADLIIKNPGVPKTSAFLGLNNNIETDISLFLRFTENKVYAVTGSKGKSTTVSALQHFHSCNNLKSFLGGNITVSPLSFYSDAVKNPDAPVILEMSSWQLADLPENLSFNPDISLVTNIMNDHQNSYHSLDDYAGDKALIFSGQSEDKKAVFNLDDSYTDRFSRKCRAEIYYVSREKLPAGLSGAYLEGCKGEIHIEDKTVNIDFSKALIPGSHNRLNMLNAALIAALSGMNEKQLQKGAETFKGIEHRLEKIGEKNGIVIYNDSAATIPDATAQAVKSFSRPVVLITGGTDKEIDFSVLESYAALPKHTVFLEGNATEKMIPYFRKADSLFSGPFSSLEAAVQKALSLCSRGDVLLFSPGATSFGMFLNEFDRGRKFKAIFG